MVLEELDKFKGRGLNEELKYKAREIIRLIRENEEKIEFVYKLRIDYLDIADKFNFDMTYQDNKILMLQILDNTDIILLTNDQAMNFKARALNIKTKFSNELKKDTKLYSGVRGKLISNTAMKDLMSVREESEILSLEMLETIIDRKLEDVAKNEFIHLMDINGNDCILRQRTTYDMHRNIIDGFMKISKNPNLALGISPKNKEQMMLSSILRDKTINIVTVSGESGSGKTMMSLAQALRDVEYRHYDKVIIGKDITPLSKHQYAGYTTGSTEEKLLTYFGNYTSTIEYLFKDEIKKGDIKSGKDKLLSLIDDGKVEILDISSIKGSSFDNKIIILDEVQTLSRMEMRAVITRIKDNCKLILIGDLKQGAAYNPIRGDVGLEEIIELFKPFTKMAHITLQDTMRGIVQNQVLEALERK